MGGGGYNDWFEELREQLGTSPLEFYYLVPEEQFASFVTKPVDALSYVDYTHVWQILIPNPNGIPNNVDIDH